MRITAIISTIALTVAIAARADYHYASHTGSNMYPYTSWETAADSITAAMRAADPYDTVYIGAGDYNEIIRAANEDTCLTFIGAGIDSTRVWQDSVPNTWLARDNTLVKDIFFDSDQLRNGFGGYFDASLIVIHCKFTGGLGILAAGDSTTVENCEFYNIDEALNMLYTVKLVFRNNYIKTSISGTLIMHSWILGIIENNIVLSTGNTTFFNGISERTESDIIQNNYLENMHHGYKASAPLLATVENNTNRNSVRAISVGFYLPGESGAVWLKNNAITESEHGVEAALSDTILTHLYINYNGFWGNAQNIYASEWASIDTFSNIDVFPMYANPDSFDVHLQAYSPFIDAGDPDILDIDGSRSDIGVFGGLGGTSYQYHDLSPRTPDSLWYRLSGDSIVFGWRNNYEADFNRYIVWRDTLSGFNPWAGNIISEPDTSLFNDLNWDRSHNYYYRVAAYDNQWNLSPYSIELEVPVTSITNPFDPNLPQFTEIKTNYPNPFNGQTTISYYLADLGFQPAEVKLIICDIGGRLIRTLIDSRQYPGDYRATWDGRNEGGGSVSSGIYFARLIVSGIELSRARKIVLIR